MTTQSPKTILTRGGLDLVTPPIAVKDGRCIAASNYEADASGYTRFGGYERFDGQTKPSAASYWILDFDAGTAAISEGDTVTGATSGATGKALIDAVIESGSYVGTDAAGYLVLTAVTGTFQDNENLQVSAVTKSVADGSTTEQGADTDTLNTTYLLDAVTTQRALIGEVTGSGPVRGVFSLAGSVYAIRDNAGATAGQLWKATTAGWSLQTLGHTLDFTAGAVTTPEDGETITGGTSGATATVERVILQSGAWAGTAAGYLVLSGITGTFSAAETLTFSGTATATNTAAQAQITIAAGGKYEFKIHNFFGTSNLRRAYGAGGVDYAFEWDGTVYTPIKTGLSAALDKPTHISEFASHLFLGYLGGGVQNSGTGLPLSFTAVTGAVTHGIGSDCHGFVRSASALVFLGEESIHYLTGSSSSDFVLRVITDEAGALEWTAKNITEPIYMDQRGVRRMTATEALGGFRVGTLTEMVEPLIRTNIAAGILPVASQRVKARDIYRIFFNNKTGLSIYFGRNPVEIMPFDLEEQVYATSPDDDATGSEELFVTCADDGYVYQMESGRDFDGVDIEAFFRLGFHGYGAPRSNKRFHVAQVELDGGLVGDLSLATEVDYADGYGPLSTSQDFSVQMGGGFWNQAIWNQFLWSAGVVGTANGSIDKIGRNLSIAISCTASNEDPHTITALTVNTTPRTRTVRKMT